MLKSMHLMKFLLKANPYNLTKYCSTIIDYIKSYIINFFNNLPCTHLPTVLCISYLQMIFYYKMLLD